VGYFVKNSVFIGNKGAGPGSNGGAVMISGEGLSTFEDVVFQTNMACKLILLSLYCTVLYCAAWPVGSFYCILLSLYSRPVSSVTVLYCTVLYCAVLYCTVQVQC